MDSRVEELLEKYWAAESSIAEEQELRKLVSTAEEVPEELKGLFDHFETEQTAALGEDFDQMILSMIETETEKETKVINLSGYFKQYASIAAAVLVLCVSSYFFIQQQKSYEQIDTFDSPELALKEFKKQMLMVSSYMNTGSNSLDELSNMSKANTAIEDISLMGEAARGMSSIKEMSVLQEF
ncbi:MAG: hypothetical protein COW03_03010 [Cytophagales bacterium CG12_big_fil_rev_8_21_14_0_65_40_12]|nr:MAG: hypothetical protein COW03_03010 [Cytophagales bacterium CG12_big_fil_rev_8_21_14_0_65_40_12]PIW06001.1 MAG: hypothetical protein COW40_01825 [Cytophagales bacterium CG17_big_fil_post_rev_8_21_14_2_50_40_13]